jgi:isopentenyl-diphosphate delta-isomerase
MTEQELVVLLDAYGAPCGSAPKQDFHDQHTPFHLAFSCYVFDAMGRTLVTRRALTKAAWPGVWTNSFCGHPAPGENMTAAIRRRGEWELGIELDELEERLPDFRYRAVDPNGVVENEFCPVFSAVTVSTIAPRDSEVCEFRWASISDVCAAAEAAPWAFSPWLVLQLELLRSSIKDRMLTPTENGANGAN